MYLGEDPFSGPLSNAEIIQRRLLATIVNLPEGLHKAVSGGAHEGWFTNPFLKSVWRAALRQGETVGACDYMTILVEVEPQHPELRCRTEILDLMAHGAHSTTCIRAWCASLRAEEAKAKAIQAMLGDLPSTAEELSDHLAEKARELADLSALAKADHAERPEDLMGQIEREIESVRTSGSFGLECGITALDIVFRGWRPGEVIVCGARPSVGKSAFAVTAAVSVIQRDPLANILYGSVEMRAPDVGKRILSCHSGVTVESVEAQTMSASQRESWEVAAQFYLQHSMEVRHQGMSSPQALYAAARQSKLKRGRLDLVIVDHMHIMRGEGKTDTERLTNVSKSLVKLAHDLEVPVLALAQLNRQVEHRDDPVPTLADLRGSGSIEEDGDIIFFLHKPSKDNKTNVVASIAKHRRGGLANVSLTFEPALSRFSWQGPKDAEQWSP